MSFRLLPFPLLALCVATAVHAEDAAADLDRVLVTATRTEIPLEDSLLPAQIIDQAEIQRSQATSLPELLRGRAGIDLANSGGPGKQTSLFLRGTNANQTLILIDGIRVGSATTGAAALNDLPLGQIERIEIVRGPRSSLYGSEAIGGVIQIFTRQGGAGLQQNLHLGAGSHHLREAGAGLSYRGPRGWIAVQGAYQDTDGIDACRGTAAGWGAGCYVDEPDRDGYRNVSVSMRGGMDLSDALTLEGHFFNASSQTDYDGDLYAGNESEGLQRIVSGKLGWRPSERLSVTLQAGRTWDALDSYHANPDRTARYFVSTFDTRRDSVSLQGDIGLSDTQWLSIGADGYEDRVTSSTAYDATARHNIGVFAEYQVRLGAHQWQASVRNDDNQQFGNHVTGSVGWGMTLGHGITFTVNYGTGFKAPTFNDLYYPYFGNPNLDPEESRSLDLGIAQRAERWRWSFNLYETHIDDLISYDSSISLPNNIDKARIRGAELTGAVSIAGWDIAAQWSHTDPRNRSHGAYHDYWLPRRARNTGRLDIDRAFGAFRLGVTANAAGHRYDQAANTTRLGGYATVDLRLEYAITPAWTLQARASNLFDRDYETVAWFNQPGREYGVSVRYQAAVR